MSTSKYEIIASDLAKKIKYKIYEPGSFLPSENQLTDLYGTSRETIRKVLKMMQELGLIQKIRGKGSLVLDLGRYSFPISGLTSFKELNRSLGMNAETILLENSEKFFPSTFMGKRIAPEDAIFLKRLRKIDGEPAVVDVDYLIKKLVPSISNQVAQDSIYDYLENKLSLKISYATKVITVEKADESIAKTLNLAQNSNVVIVRSMVYLDDTSLLQLTISYHRPDKFEFTDFARRQKI